MVLWCLQTWVTLTWYVEIILLNPAFISGLDSFGYIFDINEKGKILFSNNQCRIKMCNFNWMIKMHSDSFVKMSMKRKVKCPEEKGWIPPPHPISIVIYLTWSSCLPSSFLQAFHYSKCRCHLPSCWSRIPGVIPFCFEPLNTHNH